MVATLNRKPGQQVSIVADYPATPVRGDIVRYGNMLGIAQEAEDSAGETSTDFGSLEVIVPVKATNGAIAKGDPIYYVDHATEPLTNTPGGLLFGFANEALASGQSSIAVFKVPSQVMGIPRTTLVAGGVPGNFTVTGIKQADKILFVGRFTTAAAIASLSDLTSEFSITAANTINNTGGTGTANDMLFVNWLDLTP